MYTETNHNLVLQIEKIILNLKAQIGDAYND